MYLKWCEAQLHLCVRNVKPMSRCKIAGLCVIQLALTENYFP